MNVPPDRSFAEQQDRTDPLAKLRDAFRIPTRTDGTEHVYFCGHSLGLQPKAVGRIVEEELDSWAQRAVEGHFESARPWLNYHERFAPSLARLVGAQPLEVVAMNTLTVNLHLMLATFYRPTRERWKLLVEKHAFSSDRYAVASQARLHGFDPQGAVLEIAPRAGEEAVRTEDVLSLIEREGRQIATVMLPGVQYLNGQRFDLQAIAREAHRDDRSDKPRVVALAQSSREAPPHRTARVSLRCLRARRRARRGGTAQACGRAGAGRADSRPRFWPLRLGSREGRARSRRHRAWT